MAMRAEERAAVLGAIAVCRTGLESFRRGVDDMLQTVREWRGGRKPTAQELKQAADGFSSGGPSLRQMVSLLDECERLIVLQPGTDSPTDDELEGQSEQGPFNVLESLDRYLTGAHAALTGASTLVAALAQGQRLEPAQYQEKQDLTARCCSWPRRNQAPLGRSQ